MPRVFVRHEKRFDARYARGEVRTRTEYKGLVSTNLSIRRRKDRRQARDFELYKRATETVQAAPD